MTEIKTDVLDPRVAAIRAYGAAGFALIPCDGKIPSVKNWTNTLPGAFTEKELSGNYGVVVRDIDLVVDVDPRNFPAGDDPLARIKAVIGPLTGTFVVRTGGGGLHIYFRKAADLHILQGLKEYPGIEFKTAGRQVIGPGSTHPDSGKKYEAVSGNITEIADAPHRLLSLLKTQSVAPSLEGTGNYIDDAETQERFADYLRNVAEPSIEGEMGDHNAGCAVRGRAWRQAA